MKTIKTDLLKQGGEITMKTSFDMMCSLLPNGEYVVKIEKKKKPRTLAQNRLLWMWYKCIEESTGTDKTVIHDYYKTKFLVEQSTFNGRAFYKVRSTTDLNTEEFTQFMDKVKADAATELGVTLPSPEDLMYEEFIEYYNNRI